MKTIVARIAGNLFVVAVLALAMDAHAMDSDGHMAVGDLADRLLKGTRAEALVRNVLGEHNTLREAAVWPDCVRGVDPDQEFAYAPKYNDPACAVYETKAADKKEMSDYARRNHDNCIYAGKPRECHKAFHFADIPLQQPAYTDRSVGASNADIVHAMRAAVALLKYGTRVPPFNFGPGDAGQREALRLLAHLAGDVHQPLHVGAIFLLRDGRPINPDREKFDPFTETIGGNALQGGPRDNWHKEWDDTSFDLGDLVSASATVIASQGSLETWPEAWATDTLSVARTAFKGLRFAPGVPPNRGWQATATDPQAYAASERSIKLEQITKAGTRLAEMLRAIWPD